MRAFHSTAGIHLSSSCSHKRSSLRMRFRTMGARPKQWIVHLTHHSGPNFRISLLMREWKRIDLQWRHQMKRYSFPGSAMYMCLPRV